MNTGTAHGQTDPCDTPPSSDSGVHSLEEQWENMSTESLDTASEQIEGGPEQLASENSELMETKTAVGIETVGMDCVLRQEPVVKSPPSKQPEDGGVGVKMSANVIQVVPVIGTRILPTWQIFLTVTARRVWNYSRNLGQEEVVTARLRTYQNRMINRPSKW